MRMRNAYAADLKGNMPDLRMRQNIPRHRLRSCSTSLVSDSSIAGVVSACALVADARMQERSMREH